MPGPFRTRAEAIAHAKRRTPRYHVPFPDLSCQSAEVASCSNRIVNITPRASASVAHPDARQFPVGHNHKQGLELITPAMQRQLEWMGGKKS